MQVANAISATAKNGAERSASGEEHVAEGREDDEGEDEGGSGHAPQMVRCRPAGATRFPCSGISSGFILRSAVQS